MKATYIDTLTASHRDLEKWAKKAPGLLTFATRPAFTKDKNGRRKQVFMLAFWRSRSPRCFFLSAKRKGCYSCKLGELRPYPCRDYPVDIEQMKRDGCEMLEPSDEGRPEADLMQDLRRLRNSGWRAARKP